MYIGRVITNSKKIEVLDFIDKTADVSKVNGDIPTLIVGKSFAESIYGKENVRILDKKLSKNVYWTYSKAEKRNVFETDFSNFEKYVISYMLRTTKYQFFSLFRNSLSRKKGFIRFLDDRSIKKTIYIRKNHIYIYYGSDLVIGISLGEIEYLGINREKAIKRILENPSNALVSNTKFLSYRILSGINTSYHVIPYLYAKKNGIF